MIGATRGSVIEMDETIVHLGLFRGARFIVTDVYADGSIRIQSGAGTRWLGDALPAHVVGFIPWPRSR